ncbi:MAG: FtsX-like permease family protein [Candidatus Lokiarchaeota archaeon]|nr:FtsX-like permease family protein [Candidatus Lokiarchaeota archaeon]MBD3202571.1 FtsX-like permease family protein [Candidatus Lokiarchaeota archaeon]
MIKVRNSSAFELKIAFRILLKNPIRTIFSLFSIILGVSIFFSVNIATDSLSYSLYNNIDPDSLGDADKWVYLFRGILSILSGISMIISIIIIKNLMEMSKEDQRYEIGLLRTIGSSKFSIFLIFFFQVITLSILGLILGLIFGYFLSSVFFGPLKQILTEFLSLQTEFSVETFISSGTITSSILVGLLIPLIFGMIPAISASKTNILSSLKPYLRIHTKKIRSKLTFVVQTFSSLFLIILALIVIEYSFTLLVSFNYDPTIETNLSIILLFISGLFFITGSIIFGATLLPYLTKLHSYLLSPILKKMKTLSYRNLIRNRRRSRNTFYILSISLSFLIMIQILFTSVDAGIIPGARMRLGGDITLGRYWNWDQTRIPMNTSSRLRNITEISGVCEVKNTIYHENYAKCDTFGENGSEIFLLYVINTSSYVKIHNSNSISKFQGEKSLSNSIGKLNQIGTIILQDDLSDYVDKKIGHNVNISTIPSFNFPGIDTQLKVVGIGEIIPGISQTWEQTDSSELVYTGLISWETYFNITATSKSKTTSYFWVGCEEYSQAGEILETVKSLYEIWGYPWNITATDSEWVYRSINKEISLVKNIVNMILVLIASILYMAILISMFGSITSMVVAVNKRRNELGILRAIGTTKQQIIKLISGELLILSFTASSVGIISGILAGYLLSNVPFIAYVPFIFTINWYMVLGTTLFVIILNFVGSILPAYKATRMDIIKNIRKRGT